MISDGHGHVILQFFPAPEPLLQAWRKPDYRMRCIPLHLVHGKVGRPHDVISGTAGRTGDARRQAQESSRSGPYARRVTEKALCCPCRFILISLSGDDGKLIATDAEYVRFGAGKSGQQSGQSNQYSIALRMPVKVVNAFKIINVNQVSV